MTQYNESVYQANLTTWKGKKKGQGNNLSWDLRMNMSQLEDGLRKEWVLHGNQREEKIQRH